MNSFPLQGVIGIVSLSADELAHAVSSGLHCVEVRADLLLQQGCSEEQLLQIVSQAKVAGLGCLVTVRHVSQGGSFDDSEERRIALCQAVLRAGADILDVEYDTQAARQLSAAGAPLILSYHNFERMLPPPELAQLTLEMTAQQPLAIKVIPTASTTTDALQMLSWVSQAAVAPAVRRIGFAMGLAGACSRILTTLGGAPVTYAGFTAAVAPGQLALHELLDDYRVLQFNSATVVTAVCGDDKFCQRVVADCNKYYQQEQVNRVAVGFGETDPRLLQPLQQPYRITELLTE